MERASATKKGGQERGNKHYIYVYPTFRKIYTTLNLYILIILYCLNAYTENQYLKVFREFLFMCQVGSRFIT